MKRVIIWISCCFPIVVMGQQSFTVRGSVVPAVKARKAILRYPGGEDSARITNGKFEFTGKVQEPFPAMVFLDHGNGIPAGNLGGDAKFILIEPGELKLEGNDSIANALVSGGPVNTDLAAFSAFTNAESKRMQALQIRLQDTLLSNEQRDAINKETMQLTDSFHAKQLAFIRQHTGSYFSLMMLRDYVKFEQVDTAVIRQLFHELSPDLRSSATGLALNKSLNTKTYTINVGDMAPDFEQTDLQNKPLRLSSLRGKYVLVDFWASWCKPCRVENPNLVKCFNRYKDKNFIILGVSLDMKKEAWQKAIKDDQLDWLHVSDLKFWQNEVALMYRISSVPQNFLLDPEGKVIAVSLFGNDLALRLEELLK